MSTVFVSDQYASNSTNVRSESNDSSVPVMDTALAHVALEKLSTQTSSGQGVTITELPVTGLLVLRAQKDKSTLNSALKFVLGMELPSVLSITSAELNEYGSICVRWIAPDEWLLSCDLKSTFDIETKLREKLSDASAAIVNVSGGFTLFKIKGPHANDVLKKSTSYDTHPENFIAGKVVNTVVAKAQATIRCVEPEHYELIIRRSFADYVLHWLQVASNEYGLVISR